MADEEAPLIQALRGDNHETLMKELNSYQCFLAKQEKPASGKSQVYQDLTSLLVPQLLKSSDVLFLDVSMAILRYMSRDASAVLRYMSNPVFVEFLCLVGGFEVQKTSTVLPFDKIKEETEVDSCRCLCNVMYLTKDKFDIKPFGDQKFLQSLVRRISNHKQFSFEQNKIILRLLFLVAALSAKGRKMLIEEYDARKAILDSLNDALVSDSASGDQLLILSEIDTEICCEILKVVFYLNMDLRRKSIYTQLELQELEKLVELCAIVLQSKSEKESLTEGLHCNAGNAIYSIPPGCLEVSKLIGSSEPGDVLNMKPVVTLLDILRSQVMKDNMIAVDILHPLFALFSELCRLSRDIRLYVKKIILPPRKDFKQRPEEGGELRNKLIKLFTHNNTDLKHGAADFIFVLCKEKTDRFVKYTGYGNAAGLLHLRGLLAGGRGETVYSDTDSDSDTEEYKQVRDEVNPVTGHIPTSKANNPLENMTEEQKEYLAMQLANQVTKLSTDSVIQPMCVGEDGKLIPFQQKVHETQLPEDPVSSDDD